MKNYAFQKVVSLYRTKAEFCRAIGMSPQFLVQIEAGERPVPPRYAVIIEREAKKLGATVTVHDLRPDVFGLAPGITQ